MFSYLGKEVFEMEEILQKIYGYLAEYGLKILAALLIFIIGRWLAKVISKAVEKSLLKAKVDKIITKFVKNLTQVVILIFVIIAVLANLGVETAQFAVAIGAAGLAIGLALQGSLANFASGFLMIIFRPFKVGDLIEASGVLGRVEEIQLFNTILNTPDNIRVIIPNAQVTGSNILNYTTNGTRRVDLVIGVSYEDDLKRAKEVIEKVLAGDEKVLKNPAPTVAVSELGDSSVNFVVRPWVKAVDYWDAYFDVTAKVKLALDKDGISIPYPQRDVHIKDSEKGEFVKG
jgi:small conductance mechanosensitive channel